MKLTPWFNGDIKPKHKGWYELRGAFSEGRYAMRYWNGRKWFWVKYGDELLPAAVSKWDEWRGVKK